MLSYCKLSHARNPLLSKSCTLLQASFDSPRRFSGICKQAIVQSTSSLGYYTKKKIQNMTYCRWASSKQLLHSLPALCSHPGPSVPGIRHYTKACALNISQRKLHKFSADCFVFGINRNTDGLFGVLPSVFWTDVQYLHNYRSKKKVKGKTSSALEVLEEDPFSLESDEFGRQELAKRNADFITERDFEGPQKTEELDTNAELSQKEHESISKTFPVPKVTLNNLTTFLNQQFYQVSHKPVTKSTKKKPTSWCTTYTLTWPSAMKIEATGISQKHSSTKAALKVVHILYTQKSIDKNGQPIYKKEYLEELKKNLNTPMIISIEHEEEEKIKQLLATYSTKIEPLLEAARQKLEVNKLPLPALPAESSEEVEETEESNIHNMSIVSQVDFRDNIFAVPPGEKDQGKMMERNELLQQRQENARPESKLPISDFRQQIVSTIAENQAVVIRGAPGCGKSTRAPAYILEAYSKEGRGAECNILVSQPRRVAALSLATRVAQERGEEVGDVIGHQVRLSTRPYKYPGGGIQFCTAGALLRRLASCPDLPGCSHLILDEAHERSADTDAMMTLAKRAMVLNPNLKVVIMSATLDTELFSGYFGGCPVLDIPGFTFPVTSHFLEDFAADLNLVRTSENIEREDTAAIDAGEVTQVIKWVDSSKGPGAILCFLPGWQDIRRIGDNLEMQLNRRGGYMILPVHSRLSNEDQRKIFSHPPEGVRKIILATNIAETSITIDDVSYVIDTGIHKEHKLMDKKGISSLDKDWISRASVFQRRGRAGRVKPGESFHLYTRQKMESFVKNPIPEILRVPLEKTVMDCKTYSTNEKALDFLGQFPQPPSPEAIKMAVDDLINMGALDEQEQLTPLGRRIASFTTHPKISKALVHATIFKVASPVIDLATILSNNIDLFSCAAEAMQGVRRTKEEYHPTSDHMALYWLTRRFQEIMTENGSFAATQFCKSIRVRRERMNSVYDLRKICVEHLQQCRMLPPVRDRHSSLGDSDTLASVDELVKGVLLSGLNTTLHVGHSLKVKGKLSKTTELFSEHGQHAFLSSSSVNQNIQKRMNSGALLYCGAVHSKERRGLLVRDTSLLQPITLFLFSPKVRIIYQSQKVSIFDIDKKKLKMQCSPEHADLLLEFHRMVWSVVQYYIENKGFSGDHGRLSHLMDPDDCDEANQGHRAIEQFKDQMVRTVAMLLNEAELSVDLSAREDK